MLTRADLIPVVTVDTFTARAYVCARVSRQEYDELVTVSEDFTPPDESMLFAREWVPVTDMSRVGEVVDRYVTCRDLDMDDFMGGFLFRGDDRPWEHDPRERYLYSTTDYLDYAASWWQAAAAVSRGRSHQLSIYGTPFHVDPCGDRVVLRRGLRVSPRKDERAALDELVERGAWDLSASANEFVGQIASQVVAYVRFARAVCAGLPVGHAQVARPYVLGWASSLEQRAEDLANQHPHGGHHG